MRPQPALRQFALLLCFASCLGSVRGQAPPASAPGTGTVTGHVLCGDTQRPARFASVLLFAVPASVTPASPPSANPTSAEALKTAFAGIGKSTFVQGSTGLDGSFVVTNVPPGDYYAFPGVPGYVQGATLVQAAYAGGADLGKPVPGIPIVHVTADHTANAELSAERGAAISGHVLWDDGSPASRLVVTLEPAAKDPKLPPQFAMLAGMGSMSSVAGMITDELGRFRLPGLLPGEYLVKASLTTGGQFAMVGGSMQFGGLMANTPLVIYAPDALHKSGATPIKIVAGADHDGEDITIRLGSMHTVAGSLRSAADGHGINSGTVRLTDAADKNLVRSAAADADGNFNVTLVPPGTYNLTVDDAADTRPSTKKPTGLLSMTEPQTVRSYDEAREAVVVTDTNIAGRIIDLQPSKEIRKQPDLNDLLGGAPPTPPPSPQ